MKISSSFERLRSNWRGTAKTGILWIGCTGLKVMLLIWFRSLRQPEVIVISSLSNGVATDGISFPLASLQATPGELRKPRTEHRVWQQRTSRTMCSQG
jgi:hypothetical protein